MQKNWPDNDIVNKLFDFIMIHLWKVMLYRIIFENDKMININAKFNDLLVLSFL